MFLSANFTKEAHDQRQRCRGNGVARAERRPRRAARRPCARACEHSHRLCATIAAWELKAFPYLFIEFKSTLLLKVPKPYKLILHFFLPNYRTFSYLLNKVASVVIIVWKYYVQICLHKMFSITAHTVIIIRGKFSTKYVMPINFKCFRWLRHLTAKCLYSEHRVIRVRWAKSNI